MNIGAPISAVNTPMGTSDGAKIVRLMVSALSNNTLPKIADKGKMM